MLKFLFSETVEGYQHVWLLGDNFVAQSYRDHVKNSDYPLNINSRFEVEAICKSRFDCNIPNMLARIESALTEAINKEIKLPHYIVVVLDADLIEHLDYNGFGVSTMLGEWIKYLADAMHNICKGRKKTLPLKAVKHDFPMIYWAAVPHHKLFFNNAICTKFNNCLDSVLKLYKNMCLLKMKEIWDYNNLHLVNGAGRITSYGLSKYWASIDAAIEYNVTMHEQFLCKEVRNRYQAVQAGKSSHSGNSDGMYAFFDKNKENTRNQFRWVKGRQGRPLPAPPNNYRH